MPKRYAWKKSQNHDIFSHYFRNEDELKAWVKEFGGISCIFDHNTEYFNTFRTASAIWYRITPLGTSFPLDDEGHIMWGGGKSECI